MLEVVTASSDAAVGSLEERSSRRRGTVALAAAAQVAESDKRCCW